MDQTLRSAAAALGETLTAEKQFFSRQNEVWLVAGASRRYVLKRFVHGDQQRELALLREAAAQALPVPALLATAEGWLVLEYLPGPLLADLLEAGGGDDWAAEFAAFLADCHAKTVAPDNTVADLADQNPRNFVRTEQGFYLLDLAEMKRETPERGLGRLFAEMLLFRPVFDERKCAIVRTVRQQYENRRHYTLDETALFDELRAFTVFLCQRRRGEYSQLDADALLARLRQTPKQK